jgi:flagellar hook-length control protein FliK
VGNRQDLPLHAETAEPPDSQGLELARNSTWHATCIASLGLLCPLEAKLTSHLTISYSAAAAAGGAIGTSSGSNTGSSAGANGNSAASFLEALIDEFLSGGGLALNSSTGDAKSGTVSTQAVGNGTSTQATPVPLGDAVDPTTGTTNSAGATQQPQAKALLVKLARELKTLQDQLKSGDAPDPDLLQKLGQTADALAALMAQPAQPQALPPTLTATAGPDDTTAVVSGVSGATPASGPQPPAPTTQQPSPSNQTTQFLASLGLALDQQQPDPSTPTAPASTSSQPLPGIADLASQLSDASAAVQTISPTIARKLQTLTQMLSAAEADPQSLGALTTAGDTSGKSLDTLVQSLLAAKPAAVVKSATPPVQLASDTKLAVPDALVKAASPSRTSATSAKSQSVQPTPDAGTAAPAAPSAAEAPTPASATTSGPPVASKPEVRLVAEAVAKTEATKPDATDPTAQAPDAANAAAAPQVQTAPRIIPAAYQAASAATVNMGQVAFEMARQIQDGQSRFSIRLDPPELGRVDVKMHVDASGNVNAHLTVERAETLDMFQRDKGSLERALSQAGVDTGKTNLQFSLRQNPFAGMLGGGQYSGGGNGSTPRFSASADSEAEDAISAVPQITLYRGVASPGGVNLFA